MIYLDHAATTPTDPRVIEAMADCMRRLWHNPGALYGSASEARRALRLARTDIAAMLNCDPHRLIFTSGGTEGNNQALTLARGGHAVIAAIEHASVLNAARRQGCAVTLVPPEPDGRVKPENIERALRPDTRLICVQFANNETGALQPVAEIGALARSKKIPFLCDAVQAFGHVPVDVEAFGIDLLTLSAHKLYGPRGAGCLYIGEGLPILPLIDGGGQEFGLRSGTENVPAIVGLQVAALLAREDMELRAKRERWLLDGFIRRIKARVPGCLRLCEDAPRLPGIAALLLPGLSAEQAIADLDLLGILVSGGAACAARSGKSSHVYRAMRLSERDARCVLRVSIGRDTSREAMDTAAEAIAKIYARRAT